MMHNLNKIYNIVIIIIAWLYSFSNLLFPHIYIYILELNRFISFNDSSFEIKIVKLCDSLVQTTNSSNVKYSTTIRYRTIEGEPDHNETEIALRKHRGDESSTKLQRRSSRILHFISS